MRGAWVLPTLRLLNSTYIVKKLLGVLIEVKPIQQIPRPWGVQLGQGAGGEDLNGSISETHGGGKCVEMIALRRVKDCDTGGANQNEGTLLPIRRLLLILVSSKTNITSFKALFDCALLREVELTEWFWINEYPIITIEG